MLGVAWLERDPTSGEIVMIEKNLMPGLSDAQAIAKADERLALGGRATGYQIGREDGRIVKERLPPKL